MVKIIKFEASWCGPCFDMDRTLDKCRSDFELVRVDIEEEPGITQLHRVRSVPTLVVLDDDEREVARLAGRQRASAIDKVVNSI